MTSELVYANITSMMEDERRKQTEQKLIESGKAEFLKKGYAKANLRDLCKTAGVTTGAFYFSFANKEALLAAILDPVIADYERMCSMFAQREEEDPGTADDNERQIEPRQSSSWISVPEAGMRCSEHRLNYRCRQHLPVILRNLWVESLTQSLSES